MYCRHCGKEIDDSAKFCKYCGNSLSEDDGIIEKRVVIDSEAAEQKSTTINATSNSIYGKSPNKKMIAVIIGAVVVAAVIVGFVMAMNGGPSSSSSDSVDSESYDVKNLKSSEGYEDFIGTWYCDEEVNSDYNDVISTSITIKADGTYIETINGDPRAGNWEETADGSKILTLIEEGEDSSNETFEKHGEDFVFNTVHWESLSLKMKKNGDVNNAFLGSWYCDKDINSDYNDKLSVTMTINDDGSYVQTINGDTRKGKWKETASNSGILILTRDGEDESNETFEVHGEKMILNTVHWENLSLEMKEN